MGKKQEIKDIVLASQVNQINSTVNNINLELVKQNKIMSDGLEELRALREVK
jgi:hypothetical protein